MSRILKIDKLVHLAHLHRITSGLVGTTAPSETKVAGQIQAYTYKFFYSEIF